MNKPRITTITTNQPITSQSQWNITGGNGVCNFRRNRRIKNNHHIKVNPKDWKGEKEKIRNCKGDKESTGENGCTAICKDFLQNDWRSAQTLRRINVNGDGIISREYHKPAPSMVSNSSSSSKPVCSLWLLVKSIRLLPVQGSGHNQAPDTWNDLYMCRSRTNTSNTGKISIRNHYVPLAVGDVVGCCSHYCITVSERLAKTLFCCFLPMHLGTLKLMITLTAMHNRKKKKQTNSQGPARYSAHLFEP